MLSIWNSVEHSAFRGHLVAAALSVTTDWPGRASLYKSGMRRASG